MTHREKLQWMILWAHNNKVVLNLEGECGFGRECVGILADNKYPDYEWYSSDWDRSDSNGEVWTPPDAYHKHPCVAVLGRGEAAEAQLYEWLKWFDENNFKVDLSPKENLDQLTQIELLIGGVLNARIVKQVEETK